MKHPLDLFKFCPKCGSAHFEINNFKSKKCNDCGFIYYFNSSAATAVFITDSQGRLMVVRRAHEPAKGTLDLPGGFVDLYETGEEAILREIKEETNLELQHVRYLFSIPNIYLYSGFEVHTLDMFFEATNGNYNNYRPADDVSEIFFLDRKDIRPEEFGLISIKKAVEKWLNYNQYTG